MFCFIYICQQFHIWRKSIETGGGEIMCNAVATSRLEPGFLDVPDTTFHPHPHWTIANSWARSMPVPYFYCFFLSRNLLSCGNCWLPLYSFAVLIYEVIKSLINLQIIEDVRNTGLCVVKFFKQVIH